MSSERYWKRPDRLGPVRITAEPTERRKSYTRTTAHITWRRYADTDHRR
jgi:hypothetical protein